MRRADRRALALVLCLGLLPGVAGAKDWARVRIATAGAYPPWNQIDGAGQLIGFEIDLAQDLCRRMRVACELVADAWEDLIPGLQAGRYDAIMDAMAATEARRQAIQFSARYAATPAFFAVLADSPLTELTGGLERLDLDQIGSRERAMLGALEEAFAGRTVGVEVASPTSQFLEGFLAGAVEIRKYATQDGLARDLDAGRVDLALASINVWQPLLATDAGKRLTLIGPGLTGGPLGAGVAVGIRQADDDLALLFNRAIGAAKADGTIARLAEQWLGFDASP